jgi:NB-ARC domain
MEKVRHPENSSGIILYGVGGIGKIALATELARRAVAEGLFETVICEYAMHEILGNRNTILLNNTSWSVESLLDAIATQVGQRDIIEATTPEKHIRLSQLFQEQRYLLLLHNLHLKTDENLYRFLASIESFTGHSYVIITSRMANYYGNYIQYHLGALDFESAVHFLKADAAERDVKQLLDAPMVTLELIYVVTHGMPLSLKMVVSQARFLELNVILRQLEEQRGVGGLYQVIYRQSWQQLSPCSKRGMRLRRDS